MWFMVKFAVAQMNVTLDSWKNLKSIERMIKQATLKEVKLVVFPEYFISGPKPARVNETSLIKEVQKLAKKYLMYVVGSHQELVNGKVYNTGYLISSNGSVIGKHRKLKLMPMEIKDGYSAGRERKVFKTEFGKVAIPVCYDSFNRNSPDLMRWYKKQGADFVLIPKFSMRIYKTSIEAVRSWLSAHCFWNKFYVLCSSSVGNSGEYPCFGHSLIISPESGIIREGSETKEELLIADLGIKVLRHAEAKDKWLSP